MALFEDWIETTTTRLDGFKFATQTRPCSSMIQQISNAVGYSSRMWERDKEFYLHYKYNPSSSEFRPSVGVTTLTHHKIKNMVEFVDVLFLASHLLMDDLVVLNLLRRKVIKSTKMEDGRGKKIRIVPPSTLTLRKISNPL